MNIAQERIIAFIDGELKENERRQVAAAIAADAETAAYARDYERLKATLAKAYAPLLKEPIPARLLAAVSAPPGNVIALPPAPQAAPPASRQHARGRRLGWALSLAASLLIGVLLGQGWRANAPLPGLAPSPAGGFVAQASLARALDHRLSGRAEDARPNSTIDIALSFRNRTGGICRVFALREDAAPAVTGIACREAAAWRVVALAPALPASTAVAGDYQPAGARALPAAIGAAIAGMMAGDPLGVAEEAAARDKGWR
ncbi:MAG: hypothetical protein ACOY99_05350 [Pseudomonadota bacterium]|jgi:hypothetical protein